jgi:hypothetical protein
MGTPPIAIHVASIRFISLCFASFCFVLLHFVLFCFILLHFGLILFHFGSIFRRGAVLVDLNGDDKLDLFVGNWRGHLSMLTQTFGGSFTLHQVLGALRSFLLSIRCVFCFCSATIELSKFCHNFTFVALLSLRWGRRHWAFSRRAFCFRRAALFGYPFAFFQFFFAFLSP